MVRLAITYDVDEAAVALPAGVGLARLGLRQRCGNLEALLARRGRTGRRADAPLTPWSAGRSPSWQLGIAGQALGRRRACLPAA